MSQYYRLSVFDQFGHVSKNIQEAEIAKCHPDQIAVLFPMLEAWSESQAADTACDQAEADQRKATTARDRAEKVLAAATPQWTAHMEWQVTVARMPRPEPDPAVVKKVATATKARDAAQAHLDACNAAILPAKKLRDEKRTILADWLRKWSKVDGAPKSTADLVKERSRVETEQKLENLRNGTPADYAEHVASTVGPSHLDRFKSGQGRGGSANYGYSTNRLRGAQLPMKVPSER